MDHFRDDFQEVSPYWRWRKDNYAKFQVENSILKMCMGPTEALYYSNAEISDGEFNQLPWSRGFFEVKAKMTRLHYGSAGFGFWNHSMVVNESLPVWFIYLRAKGPYPLQGFFAQLANKFYPLILFKGITTYKIVTDLLPFMAPIKIEHSKPAAQDLDITRWHVYRVEWDGRRAKFYVDNAPIVELLESRWSRVRGDVWIDNAVFYPPWRDAGMVYRHVTQENREEACLELDYVEIGGEKA